MDELVRRGMAKWPNVPAVYGWLSLDRRGHWLLKGERVANPGISAFFGRNYNRDEQGRWSFQNGPQRVYVALDYTPHVYRVASPPGAPLTLVSHSGAIVSSSYTRSGDYFAITGWTKADHTWMHVSIHGRVRGDKVRGTFHFLPFGGTCLAEGKVR